MCFLVFFFLVACGVVGYFLFATPGVFVGVCVGIGATYLFFKLQHFYLRHVGRSVWHWLWARLGWGLGVSELARRLGMTAQQLEDFRPAYQQVFIPKKNGGTRKLLVPDDRTKALQRLILKRLLRKLRVHDAAQGFVTGRSAIANAGYHAAQAVVITLDIVDFFSSTKDSRIEAYFRRIGWNAAAAALLTRLTTWEGGLPQGAPTSPALSNLVNYFMDVQLSRAAAKKKGTYTRYADDIAISYPLDYPHTVQSIIDKVRAVVRSKGYRVHSLRKRRVRRQHQRQVVTGLVVNVRPQLSREQRRWLRAVGHHLASNLPATLTPDQYQGWLSYRNAVDSAAKAAKRAFRNEDNRKVVRRRKRLHEAARRHLAK